MSDNYTLNVTVYNTFATESGIIIKGKHVDDERTIQPQEKTIFTLSPGDDYLEIHFTKDCPTPPYPYRIWAGAKAKCKLEDGGRNTIPRTDIRDPEGYYYGGSIWKFEPKDPDAIHTNDWTLIIKKYGADPEEDNVTIGSDPPP